MVDDNVQHGIDDDPDNDAEKGAAIGGLGGAAVGAAAGAAAGPVGAVVGAVVGGLTGAGASGLAVGAVDAVDNDNTVTGVGSGATGDINDTTLRGSDIVDRNAPVRTDVANSGTNAVYGTTGTPVTHTSDVADMNIDRGVATTPNVRSDADLTGSVAQGSAIPEMGDPDLVHGPQGMSPTGSNYDAGLQTPTNVGPDGTPDTRGISEKVADAVTGNHIDDKTGQPVGGINTGGHAVDGTADTRGISEKVADAVTGDRTDDKTGKTV